jgi:DNA-directed RNA polymerase specialized sigma24 family protein
MKKSYASPCTETRAPHISRNELAEVLLDRSEKMDPQQRALLWMMLGQGASYKQIPRLSREHASTVSRRFRAMVRRLRGRLPRSAQAELRHLNPLDKTILIKSLLYGATQEQIAAKLGVSRYRVRKALASFRTRRQESIHTSTHE